LFNLRTTFNSITATSVFSLFYSPHVENSLFIFSEILPNRLSIFSHLQINIIFLFFYSVKYLFFNSFFISFSYVFSIPNQLLFIVKSKILNPNSVTINNTRKIYTQQPKSTHNKINPNHTNNPQKFHSNPVTKTNPKEQKWSLWLRRQRKGEIGVSAPSSLQMEALNRKTRGRWLHAVALPAGDPQI
jgi:hypothetical protein